MFPVIHVCSPRSENLRINEKKIQRKIRNNQEI